MRLVILANAGHGFAFTQILAEGLGNLAELLTLHPESLSKLWLLSLDVEEGVDHCQAERTERGKQWFSSMARVEKAHQLGDRELDRVVSCVMGHADVEHQVGMHDAGGVQA